MQNKIDKLNKELQEQEQLSVKTNNEAIYYQNTLEEFMQSSLTKDFFDRWTELARCRAATMNKGSFFRLHRDAFRLNDQFRIFIPLNKTSDDEWMFIYDGKIERFKEGVPYILNTRKTHGSFAMADGIYHILMSVFLNEKNIKQISKMLPNCKEH